MKKSISILFLVLITMSGYAQGVIYVSGTLLNNHNTPLRVDISYTDITTGGSTGATVYTDANGFYQDSFSCAVGATIAITGSTNCGYSSPPYVFDTIVPNPTANVVLTGVTYCDCNSYSSPNDLRGFNSPDFNTVFARYYVGTQAATYTWTVDGVVVSNAFSLFWMVTDSIEVCSIIEDGTCTDTFCYNMPAYCTTPIQFSVANDPNTPLGVIIDLTNSNVTYPVSFNMGNSAGFGSASNPIATYQYSSPGTYTVEVRDGHACLGHAVINVSGSPGVCDATYIPYQDSSTVPNTMNIVNNAWSPNSTYSYLWDFGDGTTSTDPFPSHNFAQYGIYNVCLTVTDTILNCSDTYCDSIGMDSLGNIFFRGGTGTAFTLNVLNPNVLNSTEIVNNTWTPEINVFPNPAHENITVEHNFEDEALVNIYNILGTNVLKETVQENRYSFDTQNLPAGIYILNIQGGNVNKSIKFIKE